MEEEAKLLAMGIRQNYSFETFEKYFGFYLTKLQSKMPNYFIVCNYIELEEMAWDVWEVFEKLDKLKINFNDE